MNACEVSLLGLAHSRLSNTVSCSGYNDDEEYIFFLKPKNVFTLPYCYHNVNLFNNYVFLSAVGLIKVNGT